MPTYVYLGEREINGITWTVEGIEESKDSQGQYQLQVRHNAAGVHFMDDPNMSAEVSPDNVDAEVSAWLKAVQ